jgi:23S rRNA G2445 N2-methylase RlmL
VKDQVEIFLYTSQNPLHQRGYRLETVKAPLREDIAYAMLWSAGWRPFFRGVHKGTVGDPRRFKTLFDPFCGSGTIAIEAAAIMAQIPPGRLRPAPFTGTSLEDGDRWSQMLKERCADRPSRKCNVTSSIAAADRDIGAVKATKSNAERAGVLDLLDIRHSALSSHPWWEAPDEVTRPTLIVTNPPFGKRISPSKKIPQRPDAHLLPLYQTLRHHINSMGHQVEAVVLTNCPNILRRAGMQFKSLFKSTHGGMPVSAALYDTAGKDK